MKASEAKQIAICTYLNININKNEFFIKSPFNPQEKTPSFKINQSKNIWYDHARGIGGNILDLVMQLNSCNLSQALQILSNSNFSFSPVKIKTNFTKHKEDSKIVIKKIQDLKNKALLEYLKSRKITQKVAKKYLKEIYYSKNNKNYFSLAFPNDNHGFETRNAYFKGCIGHKSITTIAVNTDNQVVSIFEGFMDFLSAIIYYQKIPTNKVIILNSLSMINNLDLSKYKQICLYLDNDKRGKEVAVKLNLEHKNVLDFSNLYKNYKDFNEFLNCG